jgi:2-(1,2-epoxy-1,2-dihydrophenyl)acetyl-CoA isomerase
MMERDPDADEPAAYSDYVRSMIEDGASGTYRNVAADSQPLRVERDGSIVILTLNRPKAGNAIDVPLAKAMLQAALACDADDGIRCVILTGSGRMFCAGGDVKGFAGAGDAAPALLKELTAFLHMAIARFMRMDKPLITAINGPAAGAGFSLGILGDIALAGRSSHLSLAYRAIGFSPDAGATWLLPRLIGLRRAQEMALTDKRVSADEAANLGLVTRVCDDDVLLEEARSLAKDLAKSAVRAFGRTRELLMTSFEHGFESHLEKEAQSIARASADSEGREGVAAFLARRPAIFTD